MTYNDKQDILTELVWMIHNGRTKKQAIEANHSDWLLSDDQLNKLWETARREHSDLMKQIRADIPQNRQFIFEHNNNEGAKLLLTASNDMRSGNIITRNRALEILSDIAEAKTVTLKHDKNGNELSLPPTNTERIMAIRQITEMEGWTGREEIDEILVEFKDAE